MACIRLERDQNGYTVTATDPKIASDNEKPNTKWKDSCRTYQFDSCEEAVKFIGEICDKALPLDPAPPDPFADAFAAASADGDE